MHSCGFFIVLVRMIWILIIWCSVQVYKRSQLRSLLPVAVWPEPETRSSLVGLCLVFAGFWFLIWLVGLKCLFDFYFLVMYF